MSTTHSTASTASTARPARRWTAARTGQVFSGLVTLFMVFDAVSHLAQPAVVVHAFNDLGYPIGTSATIGVLGLAAAVVYLVPRTSVLGAILLTAYLGGAMSAQLRIGAPLLSTLLFPVYLAILAWAGLYLRNAALRRILGWDALADRRS